tara:strand:- start:395 stop:1342 length:948 start_codon:yes stop_codon:yes gene_type:complete
MKKNYFKVLRAGINTTFQDLGRNNLYHIGIPFSGAMDNRNFKIANSLVSNKKNTPTIEFAYQGPLLQFYGEKIYIAITGDVNFKILRKGTVSEEGVSYKTHCLMNGDQIDILSTNKSVYGYLAVHGGFDTELFWESCSTNTKAKIGANNGEKLQNGNQLSVFESKKNIFNKKINYINTKIEYIRVIKGTNYDYFPQEEKNIFFSKNFRVSKFTDRMGMRLEGVQIKNIIKTNIKSEGLIKGVIQVPPDGNPIIMLSDHGTIGGYPKIGVVISADYDKLVQLPTGSKIRFKLAELHEAEQLYKFYNMESENLLNQK